MKKLVALFIATSAFSGTKLKWLLVVIPFIIIGCFENDEESESTAENENREKAILLSSAAIDIDGNINDWNGLNPVISDPVGDQQGNSSTDLIALYVARSNNQLAFLLQTERLFWKK